MSEKDSTVTNAKLNSQEITDSKGAKVRGEVALSVFLFKSGGSKATSVLMHRYRLLIEHHYEHFFVRFHNIESYEKFCSVVTAIQSTGCTSECWNSLDIFTSAGLLMKTFLATVDPVRVRQELRSLLSSDRFQDNSKFTYTGKSFSS